MIHVTRYVQCHQSGEWRVPTTWIFLTNGHLWRCINRQVHDDVIKWKHFPCYWPFVREIHRSPVDSPHKGQWRWALMFSLVYALTSPWANTRDVGDSRRHRAHYDATVMYVATYTKTFHDTITCIFLRFIAIGIDGNNDSLSLVCMWVKIFSIFMHGDGDSSSRAS